MNTNDTTSQPPTPHPVSGKITPSPSPDAPGIGEGSPASSPPRSSISFPTAVPSHPNPVVNLLQACHDLVENSREGAEAGDVARVRGALRILQNNPARRMSDLAQDMMAALAPSRSVLHRAESAPDRCQAPELKPENRVGKCPAQVIHNLDSINYEGIGFGLSFLRGDDLVRIAVRLPENPTGAEVKNAIMLLFKAAENPFAPESKAAIGGTCLAGNEIDASLPREVVGLSAWSPKMGEQVIDTWDSECGEVIGWLREAQLRLRMNGNGRCRDVPQSRVAPLPRGVDGSAGAPATPSPDKTPPCSCGGACEKGASLDAGRMQQAEAWEAVWEAIKLHLPEQLDAVSTPTATETGMQIAVATIAHAGARLRRLAAHSGEEKLAELHKLQRFYAEIVKAFGDDNAVGRIAAAHADITMLKASLERADAELMELRAWKSSALEVESRWDVQEIAGLLGMTIGTDIRPALAGAIRSLVEQVAVSLTTPPMDAEERNVWRKHYFAKLADGLRADTASALADEVIGEMRKRFPATSAPKLERDPTDGTLVPTLAAPQPVGGLIPTAGG